MLKICPALKFTSFLFSLITFFSLANAALAVDSMSLTATPVRLGDDFSIKLAPGEKKQVQVKVRNGSKSQVVLESGAVDFIVAADGSTPVAIDQAQTDNRWSLASWLTLAPAEHKLASEEVAIVNVLIEVPKDALPGGHYAMIYHRPINAAVDSSGAGISQRVGTLLYVMVDGDINEEASIDRFTWPKFLENGPVNFALNINNQSDIHINTQPVVKIYNMFGREIANLSLEAKNIFPKSSREFTGTWERIWGFGYYKAVVEAAYGSQGQVMIANAGLFLIPVKLILTVLIVILIGAILVLSLKKRKESKLTPVSDLETNNEESDEQKPQN